MKALALAACMLALVASARADLPVKNMAFQEWDASRDFPTQWATGVRPDSYALARDCDAGLRDRCVVRVTRTIPDGFMPLVQNIPSAAVGGHPVKLSGMIRTRDVAGYAGLWLRVDAGISMVSLKNMHESGPRGTTDWRRFEIVVPVPANTTNVAFGVLLVGAGTAWFDDLKMEVDPTVQVADYVPKTPPYTRPVPSEALLDDSALAISAKDIPAVKDAWRADVTARDRPIRSLVSDDFADLQFLKPLLEGKRVVQLGESGHGMAESNWLKTRMVKFLHQEMGFDVIAFESSMTGCDAADGHVGRFRPVDVMKECTFAVWHTAETVQLFEYMDAVRKAGKRITLAGFDTQNSSAAGQKEIAARFQSMIEDDALYARVSQAEARLTQPRVVFEEGEADRFVSTYQDLQKYLSDHAAALRERRSVRPIEVDMAIHEAASRARFVRQLESRPVPQRGSAIRDEGMADNLDFLLDKVYPGRKVIVWAHNFHVAKTQAGSGPRAMGNWVAERRGAEVYTIGFAVGRGVAAHNDRKLYTIVSPPPDTLEAILANAGRRMSFVDFSRAQRKPGAEWIFEDSKMRDWGLYPLTVVPSRAFDGLIYIDTVTPPAYL